MSLRTADYDYPLPEDLMGRLLEYVVCHEVGHTLGFQHNMKASSMYPADKIRDREFVHKMGHTPSIMDYSRFNYVAQPEDKIAVEDLIPRIGPYDVWATKWGYMPIAASKSWSGWISTSAAFNIASTNVSSSAIAWRYSSTASSA